MVKQVLNKSFLNMLKDDSNVSSQVSQMPKIFWARLNLYYNVIKLYNNF